MAGYRVGLIADDLTGALDVAAPFAQRGLVTRVVGQLQALETAAELRCDVLSVNTGSRHVDSDQAAQLVNRVCRFFTRQPLELLYKKIDSTLRGHVAAEIIAAMAASHRYRAVMTPALPAQGRIMRNGEVYVHGMPLRETAFMRDPVAAPDARPLAEQLQRYSADLRVSTGTAEPVWSADGMQVWIADCADDAGIERIARTALAQNLAAAMVMAGSAGLAEGLAQAAFGNRQPLKITRSGGGTILYIVGSRAPASLLQAEQLDARPGCAVIDAPAGLIDTDSALRILQTRPGIALIQVPAVPVGEPLAVATELGDGVARLLQQITPAALIITGGDTAAAVLDALEQPVVELSGELLPGIPLSYIDHQGRRLPLITKAGGFGDEQAFLQIAALLQP
jgi:uncharacterized protein YgbK (DUF1537 family)